MTICNIISYENIKYKQLKLSISLNISPLDSLSFMSYKGEIDIGIRLHASTWMSFFFPDSSVVLFLNMIHL
jgi:hypothetical protein